MHCIKRNKTTESYLTTLIVCNIYGSSKPASTLQESVIFVLQIQIKEDEGNSWYHE